jgi:hypothetical protein
MRTQTAFGSESLVTVYVEAMEHRITQSLRNDEMGPLLHKIQKKVETK